jgi:hypothetical protein
MLQTGGRGEAGAPYPMLVVHPEVPLKIVKKMLDGRKMDEVDTKT